ncbi:MAG TPA: carbon monoxide dehydrogenase, partial [Acidimicrobiaceae bacterium]|nr:carbon monoxide dehydrogenase [Acidimicrobiaceae bacterium]
MELKNEIRVGVPLDKAWATLTDVEFIAPCMPGAQLTEVDGDEYKGQIKIKVGPITAQYKGTARFVSKDEATHTLVLAASGRDSRGAGNASAEVTATMTPDGDGTAITIATDLKITGKVAQLGRGVMADVTEKLIGQFAESLEAKLEAAGAEDSTDGSTPGGSTPDGSTPGGGDSVGGAATGADPTGGTSSADKPASADGPRRINMPEPEPVDLLDAAGSPLLKRLIPVAVVVLLLLLLR